jgi:hypothetical protein
MRRNLVKGPSFLIWIYFWILTGCASPHPPAPSSGVKITQNSDYDESVVNRISTRWENLLDNGKFDFHTGKVKATFVLHPDGTVSDIKIRSNTVGDVLGQTCIDAIEKSAPFPKWSPEIVKKIGNHCDVDFTFDYYEKRRLW